MQALRQEVNQDQIKKTIPQMFEIDEKFLQMEDEKLESLSIKFN